MCRLGAPRYSVAGLLEGDGCFAAGSYDELADTVRRVSATFWILGRKSLIVVIVSADHNVCARIIKGLPQRLESGIVAVCRARTKEGFMKVSQGAGSMIAAEILAQPLQLRRSGKIGRASCRERV